MERSIRLVAIGLMATSGVGVAAMAQPAPPDVRAMVLDSEVFYLGDGLSYEKLPILDPLKPSAVAKIIPAIAKRFGMANLRCTGISSGHHLTGCTVEAEPAGMGYEEAAAKIGSALKVDRSFQIRPGATIRWIDVQMRLANSVDPAIDGPCWPPGCTIVPTPPLPPATPTP